MNKQVLRTMIAVIFFFTFATYSNFLPSEASAATSSVRLSSLSSDSEEDFYTSYWYDDEKFTDVYGKTVNDGLGFYGDSPYATYNVSGKGYSSFQGKVTLDSRYVNGDYGKSVVGFYVDDHLLYEKPLSKNSGVVNVNVKLPKNIKHFSIVVKEKGGSKGHHFVVVQDGQFIKGGSYLSVPYSSYSSLVTIGNSSSQRYYSTDEYHDLEDINGNLITNGFSLDTPGDYGGLSYSTFSIEGNDYNTLETSISLDARYVNGDWGKSVVGIYADDYLLYEKEFTSKTPIQKVKISIPKGTHHVTLVTNQIKGAKGTQAVTFSQPVVSKTGSSYTSVPYTALPSTIGANDSSRAWETSLSEFGGIIRFSNGTLGTSGLIFESDYYGTAYTTYNLSDAGVNYFKAKLSLDSAYLQGDYGSSTIQLLADNRVLYSKALTKSTGVLNVGVQIPSKAQEFKILVKQKQGAKGYHNVVLGNAVFQKLPVSAKLSASRVSVANNYNQNDVVTVKSLAKGDVIKVYNTKGALLATSKPVTSNYAKISIKQLGTAKGNIHVSRTTSGVLESDPVSVPYAAEPVPSPSVAAKQVTIENNKNKNDLITVKSLSKNDVIKVYNSKGSLIATSKPVASNYTKISIKQLGTGKGNVLISRISTGKVESAKTSVAYKAE
ncbi:MULTISPECIES: NPCBM/NEW2 domain-containing protein [Priestia]|uniref:NPCBM/NEW2 domain-containing protein n=1 Tax=Priestia TaxID=2800373 RepID=UPI002406F4DC|nr:MULTISPECIES: NPCBM/NEW2 domain-containing protein [Priestia]MDG0060832.1 NPCBM/NEW2 domain-containing protein [Priestia sp. P5]WDC89501.1 NPCBM/NEW2 domain-containing protein [Priestia megaterium]